MSKGIRIEDAKQMVGKGWHRILDNIYSNLENETYVLEVKEKLGGLSFYVDGATRKEYDIIHNAEKESYTICETCGRPGKLRGDLSWILTLCEEHYKFVLDKKNIYGED